MVPDALLDLFVACRQAGGRALVVGGSVRDALLGEPGTDLDIEVHGLSLDEVVPILRRFGHVNEVGRAFGVLKVRWQGVEVDVSLPRRDTREGVGHKGIRATADPHLGVVEAARRRDLTINAIAYDPLTGAYEDPFGGRADLDRRLLRAVDPRTFGEDPLRALRVAQFVARFGYAVDPALEALCAAMPLEELPPERIRGEVEKLLVKGRALAAGWAFARRAGLWARVIPEWDRFPEALERIAASTLPGGATPVDDAQRRLALLYAAACAYDSPAEAERVLDRLRVFRVGGYPVRRTVLSLITRRDLVRAALAAAPARAAGGAPADAAFTDIAPPDALVRRLGEEGEMELLAALLESPALLAAATRLGVREAPLPVLLTGAELTALGVPAGPEMGRVLAAIRARQLDGDIGTSAEARAEVARLLERDRSP